MMFQCQGIGLKPARLPATSRNVSAAATKPQAAWVAAAAAVVLSTAPGSLFTPSPSQALVCPGQSAAPATETSQSSLCSFLPFLCGSSAPAPTEGLQPMTSEEAAALRTVLEREVTPGNAPTMLRLAFHDAGTSDVRRRDGGPNGSIMIAVETGRPENNRLAAGVQVINRIRDGLRGTAAEGLSNADLIAAAGGFSVPVTGGADIQVLKGRTDVTTEDPNGRLPSGGDTFNVLLRDFQRQGLNAEDLVNLSGSHTIGRLPGGRGGVFDNGYFQILLNENRGLPSDLTLLTDPASRRLIERYAADNAAFQEGFRTSYLKMVNNGNRICS